MKEHYSPSDFKQNTWELNDDEDETQETEQTKVHTLMDEAYNLYERACSWELQEAMEREDFEKRLKEDKDFAVVWGPRGK